MKTLSVVLLATVSLMAQTTTTVLSNASISLAATTLNGALAAGATTIAVASGAVVGTSKFVTIDSEQVNLASRSGNNLTVATNGRGFDSTVAVAHSSGALVQVQQVSASVNVTAELAHASYSIAYTGPAGGTGHFEFVIEMSTDGGATWSVSTRDGADNGFVKNTASVVNVAGTAVTWVSGNLLSSNNAPGSFVDINGVARQVATVAPDGLSLTLTASGGTVSGATYHLLPTFLTQGEISNNVAGNKLRARVINSTGGVWIVTLTVTT